MQKLYEIFKIIKIQKRIVSAETIHKNTVLENSRIHYAPSEMFTPIVPSILLKEYVFC